MAEIVVHDTVTGQPLQLMDKARAHAEIQEAHAEGRPQPHKHRHVGAFLFDEGGNMIVGIRDLEAKANADKIDKIFGGHVLPRHETAAALLEVASREYRVPTAVVTQRELVDIVLQHPNLLDRQAFLVEARYEPNFVSRRVTADGAFDEICMQHTYVGFFAGALKSVAGAGYRVLSPDQLRRLPTGDDSPLTGDLSAFLADGDRLVGDMQGLLAASQEAAQHAGHAEQIEIYDMDGNFAGLADRKTVHQPVIAAALAGEPQEHKQKHIGGMLVGPEGQIYVQIRSDTKAENAGMYDKIVGGHVSAGDTPTVAGYHEFIDEMRIPVAMYDPPTWKNILTHAPDAVKHQAICTHPELLPSDFVSIRARPPIPGVRERDETFQEQCYQFMTVGYYDGDFGFSDAEAAGIFQFASREALREAISSTPEKFTGDLKYLVGHYWDALVPMDRVVGR